MDKQQTLAKVTFHGHTLFTMMRDGEVYVAMKPIVEALGLSWSAQHRRIQNDEVLGSTMLMMDMVAQDGKQREQVFLPLKLLNGWLFGIDISRVSEELKPQLTIYKRESYDALYRYWHEGTATQSGKERHRSVLEVSGSKFIPVPVNDREHYVASLPPNGTLNAFCPLVVAMRPVADAVKIDWQRVQRAILTAEEHWAGAVWIPKQWGAIQISDPLADVLEPSADNGPALLTCVPIQHLLPLMLSLRGPTAGKIIVELSAAMLQAWNGHASLGLLSQSGESFRPAICAPALQST